jgi:hypothetical protein
MQQSSIGRSTGMSSLFCYVLYYPIALYHLISSHYASIMHLYPFSLFSSPFTPSPK